MTEGVNASSSSSPSQCEHSQLRRVRDTAVPGDLFCPAAALPRSYGDNPLTAQRAQEESSNLKLFLQLSFQNQAELHKPFEFPYFCLWDHRSQCLVGGNVPSGKQYSMISPFSAILFFNSSLTPLPALARPALTGDVSKRTTTSDFKYLKVSRSPWEKQKLCLSLDCVHKSWQQLGELKTSTVQTQLMWRQNNRPP